MNTANYNYFSDLFKNFTNWNPLDHAKNFNFDMDSVMGKGKKHAETASEVQHLAMSNMQAIVKRQTEVFQENAARMMDCYKKVSTLSSPQEILAEQANFARDAVSCNIRHLQELTDMATKAQMELIKQVGDVVAQNVNEQCEQMKKPKEGKK